MTASIEVTAPIAEGTLVVLRDVEFDPEVLAGVVDSMAEIAGHRRFLVLAVQGDGDVETWGPDDDLRAKVEALLAETTTTRPTPPARPGSSPGGWQGARGRRPEPPPRPG